MELRVGETRSNARKGDNASWSDGSLKTLMEHRAAPRSATFSALSVIPLLRNFRLLIFNASK